MKYRCVIIVPCYNEAERLDSTVYTDFMVKHPEIHFLLIDDGSTDGTEQVLRTLCSSGLGEYLKLSRNQGKAEAVRQGMLKAAEYESEYVGFWDADLATPLEELARMLTFAKDEVLYLSGCRLLRLGGDIQRQQTRHILGRIFATMISIFLDLPVYDTQCGAKLYISQSTTALFTKPFVTRWFFDVEIIKRLIAEYGREAILTKSIEIPLLQWHEISGSKLRFWATFIDFFKLIFYT